MQSEKIYFVIGIFLLILIFIILISIYKNSQIKYFKCPQKPNSQILQQVFNSHNFQKDPNDFHLYLPCGYNWIEKELNDINIPNAKYIFALKGCDKIVSKNSLWEILVIAFNRSGASTIMPDTYILSDVNDYYMAQNQIASGNVLICKKNVQRKQGLKFAFIQEDLADARDEDYKIAQVFFTNTLQIKGRKINMRLYFVILKNAKNIKFFINNNGKILYTNKTTGNEITFDSHITSYQMDSNIYETEQLPHNFYEFKKYIGNEKYNIIWKKILQKMKYVSNAISNVFNDDKFNDQICFQLFGIDMIINGDEPYLLEINKGPDMIPKCNKDIVLKNNIYEETLALAGLLKFRSNNYVNIYETTFS